MSEKLSITPPKKRGIFGRAFDSAYNTGVKNFRRIGEAVQTPNRIGKATAKAAIKGFRDGYIADALDAGASAAVKTALEAGANVYNPDRNATPTVTPPKREPSKGDVIRAQRLKETVQGPPRSAMNPAPTPEPPTPSKTEAVKSATTAATTGAVIGGSQPATDVLSNEDMSAKGYTLIGSKGGQKKWRKGAEMDSMNKGAAEQTARNVVASPVFRGRADAPKAPRPLETATRMIGNKPTIVQTGGDSTPEFDRLKAAQARNAAGTGTKEDDDMVAASLGGDVLGRQPQQVAQQRADERAGKYQAGRRVR